MQAGAALLQERQLWQDRQDGKRLVQTGVPDCHMCSAEIATCPISISAMQQ